eukprot:TRINITY_DN16608_c0_g1_i1.p1 TRINITY_DN16608_c0_g1~~TRINITY_DN16608_c0_g1_i1.p1  ORF type:complete len:625 (+),score=214.58 TRINITY_DN16608_c0_g1_i1:49-1875(+)
MKVHTTLLLTFLLSFFLFIEQAYTGIPTNMGYDHLGITVYDVQESTDFLMNVFDCEFDWEVKRQPTPNAEERGWSDVFYIHPESYLAHVVMLKCGDHVLTQYVELFEWASPDQNLPQNERLDGKWQNFVDIGHAYISFTVKDMDAVVDYLKTNYPEIKFIQDPPMSFPLRGEICTSTFIVTPWGMWIELTMWSESKHKGEIIKKLRESDTVAIDSDDTIDHEFHDDHKQTEEGTEEDSIIGKSINEIQTPAFMIDLDKFELNSKLLSNRIKESGMDWVVSVKNHKSPQLAKKLLDYGANGILVLKLSEAEAFQEYGFDDIFLANEVVDRQKVIRLINLSKKVKRLRVGVDNIDNIHLIASLSKVMGGNLDLLVEININHNRCGVRPYEAVKLAKLIKQYEGEEYRIHFAGIMGYEGHTPVLEPEKKTTETTKSHNLLLEAKELIEKEGIEVEIVTGGGSSNYIDVLKIGALTEIQAGGGAFVDWLYCHKANLCDHGHEIGTFILTQVMSVQNDPKRAMADSGFKTAGWHPFGGFPQPRDRTDIEVSGLSAEHLKLKYISEDAEPLKLGEKLVFIPGYSDANMFLFKKIYGIRNDVVEEVWDILQTDHS